jgi:hypothetical protein
MGLAALAARAVEADGHHPPGGGIRRRGAEVGSGGESLVRIGIRTVLRQRIAGKRYRPQHADRSAARGPTVPRRNVHQTGVRLARHRGGRRARQFQTFRIVAHEIIAAGAEQDQGIVHGVVASIAGTGSACPNGLGVGSSRHLSIRLLPQRTLKL